MSRGYYALVDCDGVIYDTEGPAFADMKRDGIDFSNQMAITNAFSNADWFSLFERGGVIKDSINKIKEAIASGEFLDVQIVSTFSLHNKQEYRSNELEAKLFNFERDLPEVKVNFVPCHTPKHVDQQALVKQGILFDNGIHNVLGWIKAGGYGALVVKNLDECFPNHGSIIAPYTFGANQPYFIIDDLDKMVAVKKMVEEYDFKTSYYGDDDIIRNVIESSTPDFLESVWFANFLASLTDEEMIDCYFDYDGVVVDIFEIAREDVNKRLQAIKKSDLEKGIIRDPRDYFVEFKRSNNPWDYVLDDYFINLNWQELVKRARVIDDAFAAIANIKDSGLFRNVAIASSRNTYLNEGLAKEQTAKEYGITTFSIPKKIKKSAAIKSEGNILVDDSVSKIYDWINHGGIGALFLEHHRFTLPSDENPYYIIGSHQDVFKILFIEKYQKEKRKIDSGKHKVKETKMN